MGLRAYIPRVDDRRQPTAVRSQSSIRPAIRNVAVLGFGTVGRAVAEILFASRNSQLQLTHVFNRQVARKRAAWVPDGVRWTENFEEVLTSDVDIVVELMGGLEPAHEFIRRALLSGKSVVTANKHVIAKHGPELFELARRQGQQLEYGASVGGGVPVLAALRFGLSGDRLFRACGILNGTCNYILSNMEANGATLSAALREAQKLGYAEADPSDDVNGVDAACKLAIVARLGLNAQLHASEVPQQSITAIQPADFSFARQFGCTIRQISFAEVQGDALAAAVGPALVPLISPLANTIENQNAILLRGEKGGDTFLAGRGAGGDPTAVAVVSDLLAIAGSGNVAANSSSLQTYSRRDLHCAHYLRISPQQSDAAAAVIPVLERHALVVEKALADSNGGVHHQAFILESCGREKMHSAVDEIANLAAISQLLCLPILA